MDIKEFNVDDLLSSERLMDFFTPFHGDGQVQNQLPVKNGLYDLPFVDGTNVVWGFHILEAAAEEGMDRIYCRDLKKHNPSIREKLGTALLAEGRKDSYSWAEKERIYLFIKNVLPGDPDERLLALVQGGGSFIPSAVIYSSLPHYLKNLVEKGMVDLKTAKNCVNIPEKAFKLIEEYFNNLSFSKKRIMLVNISEIISRNTLDEKGSCNLAKEIMAGAEPSSEAEKRRYPDLSDSFSQFDAFCAENLKNTGITLKSPPWFEGDSFTVSFTFKSAKQLERIISSLERLKGKTDEIFRLL
ncbi:MAG: hypothetical protein RBT69_10840 [Spirochaetia bacterium]|jgi:hypothetical protein|nr:hypothetical protein [Spirochaetia bacterium]